MSMVNMYYTRTNADDVVFLVDQNEVGDNGEKKVLCLSETNYFPRFKGVDMMDSEDAKAATKRIARKFLFGIEETGNFERMAYKHFVEFMGADSGNEVITQIARTMFVPAFDFLTAEDFNEIEDDNDVFYDEDY